MTATGIGSTLADHRRLLDQVAGCLIIALGLLFVLAPVFPRLAREWRPEALILRAGGGPIIAGAAFAVAWTPCIGPTLGAILTAAATTDSAGQGGVLLAFYSLGLAVPFLLTAVAFDRATTAFRWVRDHYMLITSLSGAVLIAMGILMLTGELTWLNAEAQKLMSEARAGLRLLALSRLPACPPSAGVPSRRRTESRSTSSRPAIPPLNRCCSSTGSRAPPGSGTASSPTTS